MENEVLKTSIDEKESSFELKLRPQFFNEYIGQKNNKENLKIFVEAAKKRTEALDHVLLYGPPGLGKTTLAQIIANEMETNIKYSSGPIIEKPGDLASILTSLEPGDVFFIDEIHRLPKIVEEVLYTAMEDYVLDIIVGKDNNQRSIRIDLPPFTLIGATTRPGMLSHPLRDRFGIVCKLDYYSINDLEIIVHRSAEVLQVVIDDLSLNEISKRSRGTPRIANRLLKRVRDFAEILSDGTITIEVTKNALDKLNVDSLGLDKIDHRLLKAIIEKFNGGPVGLEALASTIGEDSSSIEEVYEPYLLQNGLINRTPRGRVVTKKAYEHLNLDFDND